MPRTATRYFSAKAATGSRTARTVGRSLPGVAALGFTVHADVKAADAAHGAAMRGQMNTAENTRRAKAVCSLPQRQFEAAIAGYPANQVREARALRSQLLGKRHTGRTEVIRKSVTREREEAHMGPRTLIEKQQDSRRFGANLLAAIEETMKREGCSRARAMDKVLHSQPVMDAVALEKRELLFGVDLNGLPQRGGGSAKPPLPYRSNSENFNDYDPLPSINENFEPEGSASEVLATLTAAYTKDGLTPAEAIR
jgi:hypothetical protein